MRTFEADEMLEKLKNLIEEKDVYNLCPFAIDVDDKLYFFGNIEKKGHLVMDEEGELVPKDEALPVYSQFIQAIAVTTDNIHHFKECINKRSLNTFNTLSHSMDKFKDNYRWEIREIENDVDAVKEMLKNVIEGQALLAERCNQLVTFIEEKCQAGMSLQQSDVQELIAYNDEMNWILYEQSRSIDKAILPMKDIRVYIVEHFDFVKNYTNFSILSLKGQLKQFTVKKTIELNRKSMKSFEENHNGNYLQYAEGEQGFKQYSKNTSQMFESDFNKSFIPLLINK